MRIIYSLMAAIFLCHFSIESMAQCFLEIPAGHADKLKERLKERLRADTRGTIAYPSVNFEKIRYIEPQKKGNYTILGGLAFSTGKYSLEGIKTRKIGKKINASELEFSCTSSHCIHKGISIIESISSSLDYYNPHADLEKYTLMEYLSILTNKKVRENIIDNSGCADSKDELGAWIYGLYFLSNEKSINYIDSEKGVFISMHRLSGYIIREDEIKNLHKFFFGKDEFDLLKEMLVLNFDIPD